MTDRHEGARRIEVVRAFYDRHSETFLSCAGDTFQAGLVRREEGDNARTSNLYLAARAGVRSGQRLLDAGCGVGGPSIHIAEACPGVSIDAVTLSPVQVRMARERVAQAGLAGRIRVHEADYHQLPFEAASFDGAFFFESTGYAYAPLRLFREVLRVLRPGGILYIKDVFQRAGPQTEQERREQRAFDELWALHETPTLPGTAELLRQVGFEDVSARELEHVDSTHFIRSMFGGEGVDPFALNSLGRDFFRPLPDVPTLFGEVSARRPV